MHSIGRPPRTSLLLPAAALALLLTVAGCSTARTPTAETPTTTPSAATPATSTPGTPSSASTTAGTEPATPSQSSPAGLAHLQLHLTRKWIGLDAPVYLTNAADGTGRLFVVEQPGRIRVIRDGRLLGRPYLDITGRVTYGGERGLLGLAFSPDFVNDGEFYVDYVDRGGDTTIARFKAKEPLSDTTAISGPVTVLHIKQPYTNHKGGCLQFGPDGLLYIGMGDGGSEGDPGDRGQNPKVLLGKMLRIDVLHRGSKPYAIPGGQPVHSGWAPEVWMIGLRNPWRFSFDPPSRTLWIADVGQDAWEEIDTARIGAGGQNWGWNRWEGDHVYQGDGSRAGFSFPIVEYPHSAGEAIIGGYVYRGSKYPALVGTYLYADEVNGWIGGVRTTAPNGRALAKPQDRQLLEASGKPASFGVDGDGELYLVDLTGSIWSIGASAR